MMMGKKERKLSILDARNSSGRSYGAEVICCAFGAAIADRRALVMLRVGEDECFCVDSDAGAM